ncbi:hypothetical protein DERP_001000 [Dermatophagoides pteronyssinus]|uniref:Uncharacterized protein n=1 Tax=Dermatophagoides pteronyssinus TaxID=6956 RepID=A0ABQ8JD93_DERPT|nr:hypothetical protein DERP_001000 [Dermatophagoides pteronyssinus]
MLFLSSRTLISVRISLSSTIPPIIPPLASNVELFKQRPTRNLRCSFESIDIEPSHINSFVCQFTLPIILPIFIETFNLEKFIVNNTNVSHGLCTTVIKSNISFKRRTSYLNVAVPISQIAEKLILCVTLAEFCPDIVNGIGLSASSKKSNKCGLINISSGIELNVIHANNMAFFVDLFAVVVSEIQ